MQRLQNEETHPRHNIPTSPRTLASATAKRPIRVEHHFRNPESIVSQGAESAANTSEFAVFTHRVLPHKKGSVAESLENASSGKTCCLAPCDRRSKVHTETTKTGIWSCAVERAVPPKFRKCCKYRAFCLLQTLHCRDCKTRTRRRLHVEGAKML